VAQSIISKDLKQPDEFVSFWTHLGQKLSTHRRGVIAAGAAVVLGTGGGWGYLTWQESHAMDASESFALIEKNALAPVVADKADDAKAAKPKAADDILHFKTDEDRLQATIKEAEAFTAAHGTSGLGKRALMIKANALLALGKFADSATAYQQLLDGETDKSMRLIERDGLALSQEGQGQIDKAIETYGNMAEEGRQAGNFYVDRALYGKARLLQKQGKGKDAEKILREILDKSPKTSLRREIDDRLATLADQ
jgi:hypothetical protein